jgi:hypothetical protein
VVTLEGLSVPGIDAGYASATAARPPSVPVMSQGLSGNRTASGVSGRTRSELPPSSVSGGSAGRAGGGAGLRG